MKILGSLVGLTFFCLSSFAGTFDQVFAVVFIDAETEKQLGPFPFDRALLAQAVDKIKAAGGKGVVLKFFLDQRRTAEGDRKLAEAISRFPVLLQARMDDTETNPNPLPPRFFIAGLKADSMVEGKRGWIPLPLFAEKAADIGFVDLAGTAVPIVERYQGDMVKSLTLCALEMATGQKAKVEPGKSVVLGKYFFPISSHNELKTDGSNPGKINYLPFHHLLSRSNFATSLSNKVVIIGYDGPKIHSMETAAGPIPAHQFFVKALQQTYEKLQLLPQPRN